MGAQQLTEQNRETLFHEFQSRLFKQSKDLILYNHFRIDCIKDKKEFLYTMSMYEVLKNGHCEISEYICKSLKENPRKKRMRKALKEHNCNTHDHLPKCYPITDIGKVEF